MYEYTVNKHTGSTDVTLQSVYEVQSSDMFTITIPWTLATIPLNSASLTAERCYSEFTHYGLKYTSYSLCTSAIVLKW